MKGAATLVLHPAAMPASREAVHAFWRALDEARRPAHADALAPAIDRAWDRARAAHPQLRITDVELMAFAGGRIRADDPGGELDRRHAADLYLACGCARGDAAALAALERVTLPRVERGLGGVAPSHDARREVMQHLRAQMLVAGDVPPGIAAYDGRAPLATWLRVCAVRIGLRQADRARRDAPLDDDQLDQFAPGVPDPELAYLREHYGAQFRAAFGEAVASLLPRERNLLRHAVLDGLGIDQIAAIYHVHRATAARQLKQARANLIAATRGGMQRALGVGATELDSIFRVLISMADVTLREILGPRRAGRETE